MKVVVSGSRDWTDRARLVKRLDEFPVTTIIIQGDNPRGVDYFAAVHAIERGMPLVRVPANWKKYGRSAGAIRNRWMLDLLPDLVLAFHKDNSPGTQDMIEAARQWGFPLEVITEREAIPR